MDRDKHDPGDPGIQVILVVDDERALREMLVMALQRRGFSCRAAASAEEAHSIILATKIDLVLCDICLPGMDGIKFMKSVRADFPDLDFIIMTGNAGEYSYFQIVEAGAADYMTKPFKIDSAVARIKRIERERATLFNLKKINQKLALAMVTAQQASLAKGEFLARMSHEIRTPLSGIMGYTDIMLDTTLSSEQQEYVESTKKSCEMLLSVVNDILDFSRVEAGHICLNPIEFDPEVLSFECLELISTQVDVTKVELVCRIFDSVPGCVLADPQRFRQILLNLLGNAAKFTMEGVIELGIKVLEENDRGIILCAHVRDTGIGISPSAFHEIFEPFHQVQGRGAKFHEGTGLGLSICRKIAEQMGGGIRVESEEGKGSLFEFTSLVVPVKKEKGGAIRPVLLKGRRAFLVAATQAFGEMVSRELRVSGMEVDVVAWDNDPVAALGKLFLSGHVYDVGVVEIHGRGGFRGFDMAGAIRGLVGHGLTIPLIACAPPGPGEADHCHRAGFDGFLPKPLRARKLVSMIAGILGMDIMSEGKTGPEKFKMITTHFLAEEAKRSVSILLVDDNPVNQKMVKIMLSKAGYGITTVDNGRETLELYRESPDRFGMILMDINMPEMDGFETTRRIRILEQTLNKRVPIIAFTANVLPVFESKCLEAGMDAFLTKPLKREELFAAVQRWVT